MIIYAFGSSGGALSWRFRGEPALWLYSVVDINGKLLYSRGDAERMTFLRSAAKPLQVLPLFESGTYDHYQFCWTKWR